MKHILWLITIALVMSGPAAALGVATPADAVATLQLPTGDYLAGELCDCDQAGMPCWQGTMFVSPFTFPLGAVFTAVHFPTGAHHPRPDSPYCSSARRWRHPLWRSDWPPAEEARLKIPGFGLLHVQGAAVQ